MALILGIVGFLILVALFLGYQNHIMGTIGLIVVILALLGYYYIYLPDQEEKRLKKQVDIMVQYTEKACPKDLPLFVKCFNNSSKNVTQIKWKIFVHRPGFSESLSGCGEECSYAGVLPPGGSWSLCYALPNSTRLYGCNPAELSYKVLYKEVIFME